MSVKKALVIGASGFLGGHIVRQLLAKGYAVRILARASSNLQPLQGLEFEKFIGDVSSVPQLTEAMEGCDYVFHSAVNTSAWLSDSGPLYRTNVLGVINSVLAAKATGIEKFVLTSSLCTIGENTAGPADESFALTENDIHTEYIRTRQLAEDYVLDEYKRSGFPGVAGCVSNTYGPLDTQPTPHGNLVKRVALGKSPFYFDSHSECVGVVDAANALVLAAEKGRPGERYIITERYLSNRELFSIAAKAGGVEPPSKLLPRWLLSALAAIIEPFSRVLGKDPNLSRNSLNMIYKTWPLTNKKAVEDLGWQPEPLEDSVKQAVEFYKTQGS